MKEIWKTVREYKLRYEVSNRGRIRNRKTGKLLTPQMRPDGYWMVALWIKNKARGRLVHRLVAIAFVKGRGKVRRWVNHKDGNPANPAAHNLEWHSPGENNQHAYDTGLKIAAACRGVRHHSAKLTPHKVSEVCALLETRGERAVARLFGVTKNSIHSIRTGRSWRAVTGLPLVPRSQSARAMAEAQQPELAL